MTRTRRTSLKHVPTDFERKEEERKKREVRMIHRRLCKSIQFRSTKDINKMLATGRLGDKPVKFFIVSAHGNISREKVFRMPPNMAAFDLGENEYRGRLVCECLEQPLLDTIIGRKGTHIGSFFNAMLGGKYTPDPTSPLIPQIGYRTPGELAFDIHLDMDETVEDNFDNALGCWDITDAISTFNPMDFNRWYKGVFMAPNKSRHIENPRTPSYKREIKIRNRIKREEGIYLSEVIRILERKYPTSVCFIILSCCMGIGSPERLGTEYPEQPSAYTHYALKGRALGEPVVNLDCSMTCRDLDDDLIEYGNNPSLSMVLRSRSTTDCTIPADELESSPYSPI
jgi:hypothetical protein